jgi:ribosomal protein L28
MGYAYRCRECDSKKMDSRKNRYKNSSEEEKEKYKAKNRKYTSFGVGRAVAMVCAYRKMDRNKGQSCDLTKEFLIEEIFSKNCIYCGDNEKIGCDRVSNKEGHTKKNVVPCCRTCNITRMNNYTHEEMLLIGETIKHIKELRKQRTL